jgi:hypothetical protein
MNDNAPPPAYTPPTNNAIVPEPAQSTAISRYAFLTQFDTVFLIDDSGSMAGRSWRETKETLPAIKPICTAYDADGIDIYFLNSRKDAANATAGAYPNMTTTGAVDKIFRVVRPTRGTPTSTSLNHILKPYLDRSEKHAPSPAQGATIEGFEPFNIVITDGMVSDDVEGHDSGFIDDVTSRPKERRYSSKPTNLVSSGKKRLAAILALLLYGLPITSAASLPNPPDLHSIPTQDGPNPAPQASDYPLHIFALIHALAATYAGQIHDPIAVFGTCTAAYAVGVGYVFEDNSTKSSTVLTSLATGAYYLFRYGGAEFQNNQAMGRGYGISMVLVGLLIDALATLAAHFLSGNQDAFGALVQFALGSFGLSVFLCSSLASWREGQGSGPARTADLEAAIDEAQAHAPASSGTE